MRVLQRCARIVKAFANGICWVNCTQIAFPQTPWGGVKQSGFGREFGPWGLDSMLSVKMVTKYTAGDRMPFYPDPDEAA